MRETKALFCDGWCCNWVISPTFAAILPIVQLPSLNALNIVEDENLQSPREGRSVMTFGQLANYFSISLIELLKGVGEPMENMIDDLIEAGWYVLESDFDLKALSNWREEAFECVRTLMGPDHTYTQYFQDFVKGGATTGLLAGEGILNAVREQLDNVTVPQACR